MASGGVPTARLSEPLAGALLLAAALAALILANSPFGAGYFAFSHWRVGPATLGLDLELRTWASEGLLAIFFFVVGLELKREFTVGALRDPTAAVVPIVAAICGVIVPAAIFLAVVGFSGSDGLHGWAIPVATDIAFPLALLAVLGRGLHPSVRTFLLTLAVVDDVVAIVIIAVFYASGIALLPLVVAVIPVGIFAILVHRRHTGWWYLVPLAVAACALTHASGIHPTVAAVALGLLLPGRVRAGEAESVAERWERRWRPVSQVFVLPVFAFFAAGISVGTLGDLGAVARDPIVIGIIAGLVLGKVLGIWGATALMTRFTRANTGPVGLADVFVVSLLAGIGFTVALLIAELAFGASVEGDRARLAVLAASALAIVLSTPAVLFRSRQARNRALP